MRQTARLAGVGLAVLYFCSAIRADTVLGGIIAFRADVIVKQNATLEVREEITLDNAEKYYRYGFIRNLPIDSDDRQSTLVHTREITGFESRFLRSLRMAGRFGMNKAKAMGIRN